MGRYTYYVVVERKERETPPLPFNNSLLISRRWSHTTLSKLHALSQLLQSWLWVVMAVHQSWWWALVDGVDGLLWQFIDTVDAIGPHCCLSIVEVGPHGQLSMVVVGAHHVSWWLWEERGSNVWHCVCHLTPLGCVEHHCLYFHPQQSVEDGPYMGVCRCMYILAANWYISLENMMRTTRCSTVGRNHFHVRKSNFSVSVLKKSSRSGVINKSLFVNSEDL